MTHKEVWVTEDYTIEWYRDTNTVTARTYKGLGRDTLTDMMNILGDIEIDMIPIELIEVPTIYYVHPDGTAAPSMDVI